MHPGPLAYSLGWRRLLYGSPLGIPSSRWRCRSAAELFPQQLIGDLRIGLAPTALHDLADEEPEGLRLARPVLGGGVGIPGEHIAHDRQDGAFVADLSQPFGGDDVLSRAVRAVHLRQHVLADRAADRAVVDQPDQAG